MCTAASDPIRCACTTAALGMACTVRTTAFGLPCMALETVGFGLASMVNMVLVVVAVRVDLAVAHL